ncbi:MAG: paraquat-inducible protein A [Bdellovibrionaceae bacterium]|nr:paraquat-inducible protein A [Pseudobdellovibrionaceae bacterium]
MSEYFKIRFPPKSIQATFIYSLTALIFFIPSNLYPFMTVELYGQRNSSTIWTGVLSLIDDGSWPIALVVFLASLVIPLLKLIILFYLALTAKNNFNNTFKKRLYDIIEIIGRWSMLDIFLLAVLVAILKLGRWTTVEPGPGAWLFTLVVIFTMLASAAFDPEFLNPEENHESKKNEHL